MAPEIDVYDTTRRDGTEGAVVTFSVADKLRVAERLAAFGSTRRKGVAVEHDDRRELGFDLIDTMLSHP